jgi:hypothetical protein
MMKFEDYDEDEAQLLSKVKKLYHLRGKSLPLIYGSTEAVSLNEYVILIKRRYFQDEVWILLNNSDHPQHIDIEENLEVMLSSEDLALLPGTVAKQKLRLEARSYIFLTNQIAGK